MKTRIAMAAAVLALAMVGPAGAHVPYLLPNYFDLSGRDHVTVEASFTEHFFTSDVVMKSDSFHLVGPTGAATPLTATYFKDVAVLEASTPADGTWRISSGERVGRTAKAAFVKDHWVFIEPGKPAPGGATPVDMQSLTKAEVYVSRGKPSDAALAPTKSGIEFHPLTHPNKIFAGQPAKFEVLFDGKPLAGQPIELHAAGEGDDDSGKGATLTSGPDGSFVIKAAKPGVYLAMTRYRVQPMGDKPARSFTYALTFDVAP